MSERALMQTVEIRCYSIYAGSISGITLGFDVCLRDEITGEVERVSFVDRDEVTAWLSKRLIDF